MDSATKFLLECVVANGSSEESAKARWFLEEARRESLHGEAQAHDVVVEAMIEVLDDDRFHESLSAIVRRMAKDGDFSPHTNVVGVQSLVDSHPSRKPAIYMGGS